MITVGTAPPPVMAAFRVSTVLLCVGLAVTADRTYRLCLCSRHTNDAKCNHISDNIRATGVIVMLKIRTPLPDCQVCTMLQNVSKGESQYLWLNGAHTAPSNIRIHVLCKMTTWF